MREKPPKPYFGFPLYAHANGQWAKKIRGRTHFFGPWRDPDEALRRYLNQRDGILASADPHTRLTALVRQIEEAMDARISYEGGDLVIRFRIGSATGELPRQ